jgi:hypothetical protein
MDLALFIFKAWANPKSPTSLSGHRTALWWEGDSRQDIRKTGCLAMWVSNGQYPSIPCFGMSFLWILVACLFDVWLFGSLRSLLFLGETSVAPQNPPKRAWIARKSHNFGPANFLVDPHEVNPHLCWFNSTIVLVNPIFWHICWVNPLLVGLFLVWTCYKLVHAELWPQYTIVNG